MSSTKNITKLYTPEQVADIFQLSRNTVYQLIKRGEIVAKKIGKVYRISTDSIFFAFTGLDYDLYKKEREDLKSVTKIKKEISRVRRNL